MMFKRMAIMLVAVAIVFGAIFGFEAFKAKMISHAISALRNPPQTVSTITAEPQEWATTLGAVGSTKAVQGADLSPQVAGTRVRIAFQIRDDRQARRAARRAYRCCRRRTSRCLESIHTVGPTQL